MNKLKQDRLGLGLTRPAAELYFICPHEETKKLVSVCAIQDWGEGTVCVFSPSSIQVEHLDGREEIIVPAIYERRES